MINPELEALLKQVALEDGVLPDFAFLPPAEGRAQVARTSRRWNVDLPEMAWSGEIEVPAHGNSINALLLVPPSASDGLVVFAHGGGFVLGSPGQQERLARVLAKHSSLSVLSVDYRLAPENPYPSGMEDIVACVLAGQDAAAPAGVRGGPTIVAGESAGANLALAAAMRLQQLGEADRVAGALLFCGNYGLDFDTPSYRAHANGPGLTRARMQRFWSQYAAGQDFAGEPLACPLVAGDEALKTLPPLHLVSAGLDVLRSDSERLKARLDALGREDTLTIVPGVTHAFLQYSARFEPARKTLATAGEAAAAMALGAQRR